MLFRKYLTLSLFIFCNSLTLAQQNDYELFTTRDGLPHDNVLSVIQDSYGFIWLGTYNGLCMYDGQDFKQYPEVYPPSNKSWGKVINTLFEDNNHNIWVGSWHGSVSCFSRTGQSFIQYKSSIQNAKVNCIYQDHNKNIWIGYGNGSIGLIRGDSIIVTTICHNNIWSINQIEEDCLYLITEDGIQKYNISSKKVSKLNYYRNRITFDITPYKNGFYSINDKGIDDINLRKGTSNNHTPRILNNNSTSYLNIALSSNRGLYLTDGNIIYEYSKDVSLLDSFYVSQNISYYKSTIVNQFIEDYSGILWLATTTGLIKIDKHKKQFSTYSINNGTTTLTNNYARALYVDNKNDLWIGYRFGKINKLTCNEKKNCYMLSASYPIHTPYKAITDNYIANTIIQTRNGTILYGGEQGVFYLSKNDVFEYLLPKQYHDIVIQVWSLFEDSGGNIWIGTKGKGLYVYNKKNKKIYNYRHDDTVHNSLSHNDVWKIFADSQNRIWLGTKNGLDYINNNQDISQLNFLHHTINGLKIQNAWSIVQDRYNDIWVGTTESGVYKISKSLSSTIQISSLKEQVISALVIDSNNTLWISTMSGLYRYSTEKELTFFDESEGLTSTDFNFNAAAINKKNQIFLGTKLGVITYNANQVTQRENSNYPVRVSNIQVSGENYTGRLYENDLLNLTWKENDIVIDLSLLDYTKRKTQFRYKLIGNDDNWVYLKENQGRVILTNIPSGKYKFITQALKDKGKWHNQTILPIEIHPAFWQTLWFKTLMSLSVIVLVITITRQRFKWLLRKQKEKVEIEKKMAFLELDALRAQMNPHFIFNTINSIQGYIVDHDEVEANKYLIDFARLMRLFLESSKNRFILLIDEIELVKLYMTLERLRFDDKFDFEVIIAKDIEVARWRIPSLLLHPIIENAIKHGLAHRKTKGRLLLRVDKTESAIRVLIDDNGVGRKKSAFINAKKKSNHISRGMEMILDRIKTFNFIEEQEITIEIVDKIHPYSGTTVTLLIPIDTTKNIHHD